MSKGAVIGANKENKYFVCSPEGKVLAGPFATSEEAVSVRANLGFGPKTELGKTSIIESNTIGLEGYYVCIDNLPYIPVRNREDAECIVRAFEMGLISLIHKRFLGGLGDLIVLSGAAVTTAKIHGKVVLTSTSKYKDEFERIFADYPEIMLDVVLSRTGEFLKDDIAENLLFHDESISFINTPLDEFERTYKHFGIPYDHRWSACPIESACDRVEQMAVPDRKYAFVHDDPDRGYRIDLERLPNLTCYHPSSFERESILEFKDLLENADEVHVIDSVFFHFAESIKPKGRLYIHRYARPYNKRYNDYKTRYKWKVII
jgi:hypothetical protein